MKQTKKKYVAVKVETFKRNGIAKKYYVARTPKGTLDQRRPVKGSGLTLNEAKTIYKSQLSLYENRYRDRRTNVTQVSVLTNVKNLEPVAIRTPNEIRNMSPKQRKEYKQAILPAYKRRPVSRQGLRGNSQYVVQGYVHGKFYAGRSKKKGSKAPDGYVFPESATDEACKQDAWSNFLKQVSEISGHYNESEGIRVIENYGMKNIKEGWVTYYSSKSNM